jgi:ferritin-like protein
MAFVLLNGELDRRSGAGLANARRLADRLAQLGGAVTGDPSRFIDLAPIERFSLPESGSDVQAILSLALGYERLFVESYGEFAATVRDTDIVTYEEVVDLLRDHVKREDELEMALLGYGGEP